ncbi:MAG TPA: (d)CMP kinase [Acidimicrobiia bacterium]|nr:(d)CMP kinase [Acidimicrobiia bacterium]
MIIAVDGPGGSGKSTVSRKLAERLGWLHLDTGAFYRAATLAVLRAGVDLSDEDEVLGAVSVRTFMQEGGCMYLDGEDVSADIRSLEVTASVSRVAAMPAIRSLMVSHQRMWVARHGQDAVVEGRDIGTVVFPEADLKIWLSASALERARRRARQTGEDPEAVMKDLDRRDRADSTRKFSPLAPASDAIRLDTTGMTVEEVVDRIVALINAET